MIMMGGGAKITGTEQDINKRRIKDAVAVRKKGSTTMNIDEGQYFLFYVFDEILLNEIHSNDKINNTKIFARRHSSSVSSQ